MTAYWIAHVTVTEPTAYARYQEAARGVFEEFGGAFVVRGPGETVEGTPFARHVVIAFPTLEAAHACYDSAQYRAARALRAGAAQVQISFVAAP
ncbi:DUF1330 domain-containing protein [Paenirhodobacter sp.]|uniref:DUF1330 domain-containing protein n=1 Tax=Paenirhodobacter sp. TaxID=1965326 RepID=UPI003B3FD6F7